MSEQSSAGSDRRGWLIWGALAFAVGLLVFTFMPRNGPTPTPSRVVPSPSPGDEHEVLTDEGVVSFRLEGAEIVVRLAADGTTTELGRTMLPTGGTAMFVMVCGSRPAPEARRYVFGHMDSLGDYIGPEAVGHEASDGLFLFALLPDAASGPVKLTASDGTGAGFGGDSFDRATKDGQLQPSGCFVSR
ncbi:MAG: hypothetical protein ACRDF7_00095 [Candidatus Limnocylindrales bacterium]